MTIDQRNALSRVRIRAALSGDEWRHTLRHSAAQTEDERTVLLTAAVVTALERLYDYCAEQAAVEADTAAEI